MSTNFPLILLTVTVFAGIVSLVDIIYSALKKRAGKGAEVAGEKPVVIEYARAFFPVLLIVFLIRSFIIQPYQVPTGSLEPTIMPGDFILVNQFAYGLRLPVWDKVLVHVGKPERGQIGLFHWPVNKKVTFVKRVIGLPGDRISYINKVLYVNGKEAKQKFVRWSTDTNGPGTATWKVGVYQENLEGVKHLIYRCPDNSTVCPNPKPHNFYNLVVPKGKYLMMGDNRDNSDDGRDWGFVNYKGFIGKAMFVWMSWDSSAKHFWQKIRWSRIGTKL